MTAWCNMHAHNESSRVGKLHRSSPRPKTGGHEWEDVGCVMEHGT